MKTFLPHLASTKSLTIAVKQRRLRTPPPIRSLDSLGQKQGGDFNCNSAGFAGLVPWGMASRPQQFPCLTLTGGLQPKFSAKPRYTEQQRASIQQTHQNDSEERFPSLCHPISVSFIEEKRIRKERRRGRESREEKRRAEEGKGRGGKEGLGRGEDEPGQCVRQTPHCITS